PSATSLLPKPKNNIMLPRPTSIWQRDSQPNASGRPGAVQFRFPTVMIVGQDKIHDAGLKSTLDAFDVGEKVDVDIDALHRRMHDGRLESGVVGGGDVYAPTKASRQLFRYDPLPEIVDILRRIGPEFQKFGCAFRIIFSPEVQRLTAHDESTIIVTEDFCYVEYRPRREMAVRQIATEPRRPIRARRIGRPSKKPF
ncbi:hypothetical protein N5J77_29935, partial [Sphingobium yanoikuyae]